MKVACTICSRHKKNDSSPIPARLRYTASHIQTTEHIANLAGVPFFILSGKYGLISAETKIPDYDYYLEHSAVVTLVEVIKNQIKESDITEIDFYTEGKKSWEPYERALVEGSKQAGIMLRIHRLL